MMYKRPDKKVQRIKLTLLYTGMTTVVIAIVAVLVLVTSNYSFDGETGTLEQRGLVQFASIPSGATVTIDSQTMSSRTATKSSVKPGEHQFVMTRNGYEPWRLTTSINAGSLVWLNYARLVPTERTNQTVAQYEALAAVSPSPNKQTILLQPDRTQPTFRLVDIARNDPTEKSIVLDPLLLDNHGEATAEFTLGSWDVSGRYILVRHTVGQESDLLVLDTQDPSRSVNVSREFSLPITQAALSGRSGNILYIVAEGNLRKVDIAGGTISRSLVRNVEKFSLYDTNTIAYVASTTDNGVAVRTIGIYREGDESATMLLSAKDSTAKVSIAVTSYYSNAYTAIAEGRQLTIYRGHYDHGISGLTKIAYNELPHEISSVEFNEDGSYVMARSDNSFTSYGLERQFFTTTDLGAVSSKGLYWLDAMHLGLVVDGQMTMRVIDGSNLQNLTAVTPGFTGTLSQDGTYFYSIGSGKDNHGLQLQRFRMILP